MARPEGFEPPTLCLEGRCSIRLSYGRIFGYPNNSTRVVTPVRHWNITMASARPQQRGTARVRSAPRW